MARIVFSTLGSLGDLHPYMAVAREIAARGHTPVIATHPYYRARVEGAGLGFAPVRPDMSEYGDPAEVMRKAMDLHHGSRWILEHVVLAPVLGGLSCWSARNVSWRRRLGSAATLVEIRTSGPLELGAAPRADAGSRRG